MLVARIVHTASLSLVVAGTGVAQAPDPLLAGYRFAPEEVGSRPAGLGGAFVALADDTKAAATNPAGLTLIPLTEVAASSGDRWAAVSRGGRRLRLAGYLTRTAAATPSLESSVREAGLSLGIRPSRRLNLGIGVAWSRLSLESPENQPPSVDGEDTRIHLAAGLLVDLIDSSRRALPALRVGVSYRPGFDWSVGVDHGTAPPGSPALPLRRPSLIAAGLAFRPTDRWTLAVQGDVIRYAEVIDALGEAPGGLSDEWSLPDVVEPRLGVEFSAPLWCGCGVVKLRGGLHYESAGQLRYGGADPEVARAFAHDPWATVAAVGGSFFTEHFGHAVRIDIDSKDVFGGPELSFGVVFRF